MDSDTPLDDELFFEGWDFEDEDDDELTPPPWRRPLIIGVAFITVVAMALVPLYNLINGG